MRGRVLPVQKLRGSDRTLLEVQLADALGLPISQLALINVMDVLALQETDSGPGRLKSALDAFAKRVPREIADLPNGPSWAEFLGQLRDLPADRVPHSFRGMFAAELDREGRDEANGRELLELWEGTEPTPFEFGTQAAKVTRATAAPPRAEPNRKGIRVAESKPRRTSASRRSSSSTQVADPERQQWVVEQVFERLGGNLENGLSEPVLLAGIRNRAKPTYPDLMPYEILKVLKDLKEAGKLRYSAGRWKRPDRW